MIRNISIAIFFVISTVASIYASPPRDYRLVWADEFSGSRPDTTVWTFEVGDHGWGNNELQYYTPGKNALVKDGKLILTAKKEESRYTSARMISRSKKIFTYGYFEIRAKLPQGTGTWPAIWMLGENIGQAGWPACGELDIMEHVGKDPRQIHCSVHNTSGHGATPYTGIVEIAEPFHKFHLYAIDWNESRIRFLVDGKLVYQYAPKEKNGDYWPFDKPMFLIFNLAIGGNWGGPQVDDSCLPQSLTIDYVRVYQPK
jgi:beta-glucanase (GH16 family)